MLNPNHHYPRRRHDLNCDKKCCLGCLKWSAAILLAIIIIPQIIILIVRLQPLPHHVLSTEYSASVSESSFSNVENPSSLKSTQYIQLHPHLSHKLVNRAHDPCVNPLGYVCTGKEPALRTIFMENTMEVFKSIIKTDNFGQYPFVRKCVDFHISEIHSKISQIVNSPTTRFLLKSINDIDSVHSVATTIGQVLHTNGIREPFHLNMMQDGSLFLGQPIHLHETSNENIEIALGMLTRETPTREEFTRKIKIYHVVHRSVWSPTPMVRKMNRIEWTQFRYIPHLWLDEKSNGDTSIEKMWIDSTTAFRFEHALEQYSIDEWKIYLEIATLKSILHQTRTLLANTKEICVHHILELFPLEFCRKLRNEVKNVDEITRIIHHSISTLNELVTIQNYWELPPAFLPHLRRTFDELKVYINRCAIDSTDIPLTKIETLYLKTSSDRSYIETLFDLMKNPDWQRRRNVYFDDFYRHLFGSITNWNAQYQYQIKAVLFHPGILLFPSHKLKINSHQYHLLLRYITSHETTHFLWDILSSQLPRSQWTAKLDMFEKKISNLYDDGVRNLEHLENVADSFGLYATFHGWKTETNPSPKEIEQFFVTMMQLQCGVDQLVVTDHASATRRATYPILWGLSNEYSKSFNCTLSTLFRYT